MPLHLVLDPNSENSAEPGAVEVNDELNFLKRVGGSDVLFIRGRFLCDWASNVARARGWHVDWRSAPSLELRQACPALSQEQAKIFIARFADLRQFQRPISILELATSRWPEMDPTGKSDEETAWAWLVWRAGAELEADEQVVADSVASHLFSHEPNLRSLLADNKDEAWKRIKEWLRCEPSDIKSAYQHSVPLPVWIIERLKQEWKLDAVRSRGVFFEDLVQAGSPRFILQEAASIVCAYCQRNPQHLTTELLADIKPFIAFRDWSIVRELLPAKDPGSPPTVVADLFSWFAEDYLNYRLKNDSASQYGDRMRELGREFGLWYLAFYANARTGGEGGDLMSWSKTAQLAADSGVVKLLIVLDGLGYVDAKQVTEFISIECGRLALDTFELIFAPLPTVTHFAKRSLMAGVTPLQAFEEDEIGAIETREPEVIRALNEATPGQVVIWSVLEPDKTYHKSLEAQTIAYEVEGRLRSIARRVARIVNGVGDSQRLSVVITTDHGRLLSASRRIHDVPQNMQGHGRAAWGQDTFPFNKDGIYVDGPIAYIDPARFGLPETAAIVLSDDAFRTSDGRSGLESFAHGGVFPEEVLIPWVRFTRDRSPLSLDIRIAGSGQAGALGKFTLDVSNTSEVRIEIVQIQLSFVDSPLDTHVSVGPLARVSTQWTVSNWPRQADLPNVKATVVCSLPTGEREFFNVLPEFNVEEMYSRGTVLDDLL
jgi:hypothetical protein